MSYRCLVDLIFLQKISFWRARGETHSGLIATYYALGGLCSTDADTDIDMMGDTNIDTGHGNSQKIEGDQQKFLSTDGVGVCIELLAQGFWNYRYFTPKNLLLKFIKFPCYAPMCVLKVFPNKQYYIIEHDTWYVPYVTLSIHGTSHIPKCLDTDTTIFRNVDTELGDKYLKFYEGFFTRQFWDFFSTKVLVVANS